MQPTRACRQRYRFFLCAVHRRGRLSRTPSPHAPPPAPDRAVARGYAPLPGGGHCLIGWRLPAPPRRPSRGGPWRRNGNGNGGRGRAAGGGGGSDPPRWVWHEVADGAGGAGARQRGGGARPGGRAAGGGPAARGRVWRLGAVAAVRARPCCGRHRWRSRLRRWGTLERRGRCF